MKRNLLFNIGWLVCMLLPVKHGNAQTPFAFRTALQPISVTKFYSIPLPPQVLASCRNPDLTDIRIADSNGTQVPYLMQADVPALSSSSFAPYTILANARKDSSTELIIKNGSAAAISSLLLVIRNASAYRTATLSGSDDRINWFVINENIVLEQTASSLDDKFVQALSFPLSNYPFFKLTINDKGLLPLNILQAGVYKNASSFGKYFTVPLSSLSQNDSADHYTYLHIRFAGAYMIDKMMVRIKKPALYKRSVEVYTGTDRYNPVVQAELTPNSNTLFLPAKTSELMLKIYNGDNPPLVFDSVKAYQANRRLVAQLEKDKQYFLLTGNESAGRPDYDLQFFTDSIGPRLTELSAGPVVKVAVASPAKQTGFRYNKLILWVIIGAVLLILLVLTFRMSKEISNKEQQD